MLEKTLESPLDCKEIKPVHPKNQHWIFIGRTDAEASILLPPDVRSDSFEKTLMLGKIEGRWKKAGGGGVTVSEMVGWHHPLRAHESEQTPRDTERQGSLACWSPRSCKEPDRT